MDVDYVILIRNMLINDPLVAIIKQFLITRDSVAMHMWASCIAWIWQNSYEFSKPRIVIETIIEKCLLDMQRRSSNKRMGLVGNFPCPPHEKHKIKTLATQESLKLISSAQF